MNQIKVYYNHGMRKRVLQTKPMFLGSIELGMGLGRYIVAVSLSGLKNCQHGQTVVYKLLILMGVC